MTAALKYKNTFLHIDLEEIDLRRTVTCPAHVVPTTPPKPTAPRDRWVDFSDSEDEFETSTCAPSVTDCEADDTPLPTPRAASPRDEWTTVVRKGRAQASEAPKPAPKSWASVAKASPDAWTTVAPKRPRPAQRPQVQAPVPAPRAELRTARAPTKAEPKARRPAVLHRTVKAGVEDGAFKAVRLILGKDGQNMKWIKEETGAILSLRGRGTGNGAAYEELHMLIKAAPEQMESVVRKVEDLFHYVQGEYEHFTRRR